MEQSKNTTEGNKKPTGSTPPDDPYTINATVKSQWNSPAIIISIVLLAVSLGLAIVNALTYSNIADNYKIRNRPFVKIEARSIVVEKKQKPNQLNALIFPSFKLKNFGQFPAFIEDIKIWITDTSGVSKDFEFPRASENLNTKNLALFQNEDQPPLTWQLPFSNSDIERITKAKEEDYFIFKINYKILSNEKSLQIPFSYWVKYKCYKYEDRQESAEYRFWTKECGTNDIYPDL